MLTSDTALTRRTGADIRTRPIVGLQIDLAPACAGSVIVAVRGEIDLATAPQLADALRAAGERHGESIIVDLTGVGFIDCSGLRMLRRSVEALAPSHQTVRVVREPGGACDRLLRLTGFDAFFSLYGAVGDALTVRARAA